ncbi:alpha-hydroxy-acid oxidizing protein [Kribbella sandramycini]|uniref:4-hydroxymandelate oxidase n=1 Tax=Kribbella sandramycini TaxID=60450 RepID=A0A7Y4L2P8_9ACTN|nr:alpha-hydroxy acid oxidase [Kribbella sandramycini]MBB6564700.1 4-hydroxymandelate oxidase [Kribbella sandramycini]NOL42402.1 alpha-hydroxy-acid oxidizing protein [Kribbella sandramycini]
MRWIDTLEGAAAEKLPEAVHRYYRQGSAGGISVAEAVSAWSAYRFRPRVLQDVSAIDLRTTVLGTPVDTPVLVAPSTLQRLADPDGELAMAAGVKAAGSLLGVSSNAGTTFAELGATGVPWWLQIYIVRNRSITEQMLDAAVAGGAKAIVLTVDTPVVGRKEDEGPVVWSYVQPGQLRINVPKGDWSDDDLDKADDLTPDVIGRLHERTGLPVVVKGVLRGDDAKRIADAGAAGVIVSNHGGRQLDGSVSTAHALPEIAEALAGTSTELYVDGGIRRGEHILAALALGARAVFLGRPALWALAAEGAPGVTRMLTDLTEELEHTLQLVGVPRPVDLTPDLVVRP